MRETTTARAGEAPALRLPAAVLGELEAWARAEYPNEACGLLLGSGEPRPFVVRAVRCANLNRERARDRYEVDPRDHFAAEQAAREEGLEVIGVWHTHPDHPARPSETDRAAAWEGWSYVILSVGAKGVADVKSFRLRGETFVEEDVSS
jgi:proteasome lid subunit RPN8/RPN11